MSSRVPVLHDRGAAIGPIVEAQVQATPDGPLAIMSAMLQAARRHKLEFAL